MNSPADTAIQEALALHRQGNLRSALNHYNAILRADPENADALYYGAMIAMQQSRFTDGIELAERALKAGPQARVHNMLGQAFIRMQEPAKALAAFDRAIAADPGHADAHGNRANVLADLDRLDEALEGFDRALALRSDAPVDWCNRAAALQDLDRFEEALASCERAIALQPDLAMAHYNRADVLRSLDRTDDALASFERAIALRPDMAAAHSNRGVILKELGRKDEALASLDRALALEPDFADAHLNRANVLDATNRVDEAMAGFERALALRSDLAAARLGRGQLLMEAGDIAGARKDLQMAASLAPSDDNVAFALSQVQLLQGDWIEAWPNYERRSNPRRPAYEPLPNPRWNGEPPGDYRLILLTEQGFGDAFQFVRFAPWLAARGHRVTVLTSPVLTRVLSSLRNVAVVDSIETARDHTHRWTPLMSLPHLLSLTPETVPADIPYLFAESDRIAAWRQTLGPSGFKIGISWQGRPHHRIDRGRSLALAEFAPLAEMPGVRLISLQKGTGCEQLEAVAFRDRIETPGPDFDGDKSAFLDTAAVMANLDLVVTSDTSIAHLAGALGRPTFLAVKHVPDWRWLLGRDDSPWYPTMRLFRQTASGDWADVCARIAAAVTARRA